MILTLNKQFFFFSHICLQSKGKFMYNKSRALTSYVSKRWPKDSCYSLSKIKISKCAKKEKGIIGLQWCA